MTSSRILFAALALSALGACSQSDAPRGSGPSAPAPTAMGPKPAPAPVAGGGAPAALTLQAVNTAQFGAAGPASLAPAAASTTPGSNTPAEGASASKSGAAPEVADPVLIRVEVMLDRANFGPGVIDGRMGQNVKNALIAYDKAHDLTPSGELNDATWRALTAADTGPALKVYTLIAQDTAGPWSADVGEDFVKMSQQPALGYTSAIEMLAERFHMDQGLLKTLNPQTDFSKAGSAIVVVDPQQQALPEVSRIDVDKAKQQVFAYGADDKLLAVFPATVGSTERPSPKGTWKIKGVAKNPDYVYDPSKLTWGPKKAGKLHIPPGPNNPVGAVWIALTTPDYGIHGTPDPHTIGKTASHGCVRLANWDATELSKAVKPGVKVTFIAS